MMKAEGPPVPEIDTLQLSFSGFRCVYVCMTHPLGFITDVCFSVKDDHRLFRYPPLMEVRK